MKISENKRKEYSLKKGKYYEIYMDIFKLLRKNELLYRNIHKGEIFSGTVLHGDV